MSFHYHKYTSYKIRLHLRLGSVFAFIFTGFSHKVQELGKKQSWAFLSEEGCGSREGVTSFSESSDGAVLPLRGADFF